jgi:uncharacterized protein
MTATDLVRDLVQADCLLPQNRFGAAFLPEHLAPVARFAGLLALRLGADREVVELAAWLHDLAAVRDFATLAVHPAEGARLARTLLAGMGVSSAKAEAVCRCIAAHSAPVAPGAGALEEVCLSNADVLAQLARPAYWLHYLYGVRGLSREDGLAWLRGRAEGSWAALTPLARALGEADHAAVLRLLEAPERAGRG